MRWSRKKGEVVVIEIEGIHCTHCEATIKIALMNVPGVQRVKIQQKKTVLIEIAPDQHVSNAALLVAIESVGYAVKRTTGEIYEM